MTQDTKAEADESGKVIKELRVRVARAIKRVEHKHCCTGKALDDVCSLLSNRDLEIADAAIAASRVSAPDGRQWDRSRACVAAGIASRKFGQWVPQRWMELFMDAYEEAEPAASPEPVRSPSPGKELTVAELMEKAPSQVAACCQ